MKRLAAVGLIFALSFMLVCCSSDNGSGEGQNDKYQNITLNLESIAQSIAENNDGSFSDELVPLSDDVVNAAYSFENAEELVIYASGGATAEEIIAAKSSDPEGLKAQLDKHISSQINLYAPYAAAEVPKLENALICIRGDYVFCVVAVSTENALAVIDGACEAAIAASES